MEPPNEALAKVERLRYLGHQDVVTAVNLAAEQLEVDPELLAAQHLSWLLDQHGHKLEKPVKNGSS